MRTGLRRTLAVVLVLALFAMMTAGCQPKTDTGGTETGAEKGGTLKYYIGEPSFIDPVNAQESEGIAVVDAVFDSLVTFDYKTSEIKPAAAEKWEPNEDASVWTFTLRKGMKFQNGREVKAKDFKYAWERICNIENASEIAYHLAEVKGFDEMQDEATKAKELSGVVAKDDYTLVVTLKGPFSEFINVVGHPALGPVPKEEVEKDPKAWAEKPVGNGPFKLTEPWKHEQYIKTKAFADYYGTKPNIDGIDFMIFKDDATAMLEFKAGNLDFCRIPVGQLKATEAEYGKSADGYEAEPGKQVLTGAETAIYYMTINNEDPVLKNADLRRAISLAINREELSKVVYEGARPPADGMVPPTLPGYQKGAFKYAKYDVEEAKALLKKAGYPDGAGLPELSFLLNTGRGHEDVAQVVLADLAKIGIKAKIDGVESAEFWNTLQAGKYQLARDGWVGDYPVWDNFLYPAFYSKNIDADNHSRTNIPEVDKLLEEARKTADADERVKMYAKLQKIVGDNASVVPLVFYAHDHVVSARTHNLTYSALNLCDYTAIWLEKSGAEKTESTTK